VNVSACPRVYVFCVCVREREGGLVLVWFLN
jgi:hypothetical protein